MPDGALTL